MSTPSFAALSRNETYTAVVDFTENLLSGASVIGGAASASTTLGGTVCTIGSVTYDAAKVYVPITAGASAALKPDVHLIKVTATVDNSGVADESLIHWIEITVWR